MNSKWEFLLLIVSQCKHSVNRYVMCIGFLIIDIADVAGTQWPSFRSLRKQKPLQVKEQSLCWHPQNDCKAICPSLWSINSLTEGTVVKMMYRQAAYKNKIQSLAGLRRAARTVCLLPNVFTLSLVHVSKLHFKTIKQRRKDWRSAGLRWAYEHISPVPAAISMAECHITVPGLKRFTQFPFDTLTTRLITLSTGRKTKKKFAYFLGTLQKKCRKM